MKIEKSLVSGSMMLLILRLLEEKDMYGYEMIEALREKSQNVFELKAGTLYPLLHGLEEKNFVTSYEQKVMGKERKYYRLTAVVTLKKGEGRLLKSGGMWIFDNEIDTVMGNFENGDIVLVHDFDGYPMGRGFINTNSKITVRLMTRDENVDINEELLEKRVRDAWEYRKKVVDTGCCRLIFAEADFLPGIVVDKFSDVLVVQSLALGIDRFKETIVELIRK